MTQVLTTIGFDADDTLWQNERFFHLTHARFAELLADHAERSHLMERLLAAERRNLGHYGFGIKGFVLSMIETAIEVTEGRVPASVISELLNAGQEMLRHPIELLPDAQETVAALSASHRIILITKGDLLDQERKLAQSGLGELFHAVEIVSDKTPQSYATVFSRHGVTAARVMMVGNSLKSDVLPVLALGGWGVHVPHELTWAYEHADAPAPESQDSKRFRLIRNLGELPGLVAAIEG
ncbi:MAG: HAD family hydrolase [Paracoccaceae bacterium]